VDYKILNENSNAFIGSNSKNTAGDVYSFNHNLNLAKPASRREKRFFDVIISLLFIPLLPFNLLFISNFGNFISNWVSVIWGKKTWVGYVAAEPGLPAIRAGVISVAEEFENLNLEPEVKAKLNLLYAKHYSLTEDFKLLLKNYRKLGK